MLWEQVALAAFRVLAVVLFCALLLLGVPLGHVYTVVFRLWRFLRIT